MQTTYTWGEYRSARDFVMREQRNNGGLRHKVEVRHLGETLLRKVSIPSRSIDPAHIRQDGVDHALVLRDGILSTDWQ